MSVECGRWSVEFKSVFAVANDLIIAEGDTFQLHTQHSKLHTEKRCALKKKNSNAAVGWFGFMDLLFSLPFWIVSGIFLSRLFDYPSYDALSLAVLAGFGVLVLFLAMFVSRCFKRISVDETGVTEYSVLGRRRIRWQDTREIGLLIRRGKHGWSIHQKNWRENAAIYLSSRPLMDAERVGLRSPHRVHIEFPYCSDLRPANDRDRRIHAAMVQFAPAELPLPFHERLELLHPVYVVLAENADGALSETPGEIPDPAEVYYRLLNED